jgi:hypothetical protein
MIYYKRLDCVNYNEINEQILNYIESINAIENSKEFWNPLATLDFVKSTPLLIRWMGTLNLRLHSVALTVAKSTKSFPAPHIDTPPAKIKLSWPILNCHSTFNNFYKIKKELSECNVYNNNLGGTLFHDLNDLEIADSMQLLGPALIDAGQPHDIVCKEDSQFPRLGLQIHLWKEPQL